MPHTEKVLAHSIEQVPGVAALHVLVQRDALEGAAAVEVLPEDGPALARVQIRRRSPFTSSSSAGAGGRGRVVLRQAAADGGQVAGLALADAAGVDDDVRRQVREVRGVVEGRVRGGAGRRTARVGRGFLGGLAVGARREAVEARLLGCLLAGGRRRRREQLDRGGGRRHRRRHRGAGRGAIAVGSVGGGLGGGRGVQVGGGKRRGGRFLRRRRVRGRRGVGGRAGLLGLRGAQRLGFQLVVDLVQDLGPDDDVGEGAQLGDPAAAHEPGQHGQVRRAVVLAGREELVGARRGGQGREKFGQRGRQGERARPGLAGPRQQAHVAVGR